MFARVSAEDVQHACDMHPTLIESCDPGSIRLCVFQAHLRSADGKVTKRRLAVGLPAPSDVIQFDKYFA